MGLSLDPQGWASIEILIALCDKAGTRFTREHLLDVVALSEKKRFTVSGVGQRIRAAQGHSITVELGLSPLEPPQTLFHGTATRFLDAIFAEGLSPRSRQQVHLSVDLATVHRVGQRHGKPVILSVDAQRTQSPGALNGCSSPAGFDAVDRIKTNSASSTISLASVARWRQEPLRRNACTSA